MVNINDMQFVIPSLTGNPENKVLGNTHVAGFRKELSAILIAFAGMT